MNEPDVVPADSIIDLSLRKQGGDILLVEDNPVNQDVGREILECLGYRVTVAANGQEALESLTRERFALVLMDCQMPVLDGYSATRILRDQEEAARSSDGIDAHQVVIALTGHARSEDRQICIDAGMDDYLPKPFSIKQMDSLLSRWLPRPFNDPAADEEEHRRMPEAIPDACPSAASINSTGSSVSADSPLNRYYIDSIRMLDPNKSKQLLQKVVTKFIDETPRVISEIQHAVSVSDMDGVFKKAHYLKSSSANLGAVKLAEHCKALESLGRNNLPITDPALITGLEAEFRVVSVALTALLQGETA
jgi:CheY-like chemotaxis protein